MFCIYAIIINIPEVLFFPFEYGKKGGQAGEKNKNQAYGSQCEGIFREIPFVARIGSVQKGDSQSYGKVPERGRQEFTQCNKDGGRETGRRLQKRLCSACFRRYFLRLSRYQYYKASGRSVKDKEGGEIYDGPCQGMESFRCHPSAVPHILRKGQGQIDGKDDPKAVYQDGVEVGKQEAEYGPAYSFFSCGHSVYEGIKQRCHGNEHELDAGAGRGDDETEGMADITGAGVIGKRNPAEDSDPQGGRGQNPCKAGNSSFAVKKFDTQNKEQACQVENSVFPEKCFCFIYHRALFLYKKQVSFYCSDTGY